MKRIFLFLLALFSVFTVITAEAEDQQAENRRLGYFDNTRTVLLLPTLYRSGSEPAAYIDKEMQNIFRYPYYRTLDTAAYAGKLYNPADLKSLAEEAGADIVVMPVITQWSQHAFRRSIFFDGDDIIETQAVFDIYSYKKGDAAVQDARASYWKREEEGMVRNRYIFDEMMQRIYKTFPYRRVPTDVSKNLSDDVMGDQTPAAEMNY